MAANGLCAAVLTLAVPLGHVGFGSSDVDIGHGQCWVALSLSSSGFGVYVWAWYEQFCS